MWYTFKVTRYTFNATRYTFKASIGLRFRNQRPPSSRMSLVIIKSKMAEGVSQRIRNELTRLYSAINEVVNRAVVTSDDIQYFINCLEHFHRHLLRLSESGFVTAHSVRILQDALGSLRNSGMPEDLLPESGSNMYVYREKPLGRPRYFLSRDQLEFLLSLGFNKTKLSEMLGMSARTIQRRMAEYGLTSNNYSDLSEEELDRMVTEIKEQFPRAGYRQIIAILKTHGVFVREHELRESVQRCDPLGTSLRWFATIERRQYSVRGPLELWHMDGNHKLIRWRMVVHGAIDGYSRLVVFLHCSNNNRAETVLQLFMKAVTEFGLPSRLRTDKGGENTAAALYMLQHPLRGTGRGSVIAGSSTHNQRIERLWRDVYSGVLCLYQTLFYHLEEHGVLDPLNEVDLLALHTVFLPRINRHLDIWQGGWNNHSMRTARSLSPLQQFVSGMLQLRGSCLEVAREMFCQLDEEEFSSYGIDWDGPISSESSTCDDVELVEIPNIQVNIREEQQQQLSLVVDPLSDSDCHGIDLYIQARNFLHSLT